MNTRLSRISAVVAALAALFVAACSDDGPGGPVVIQPGAAVISGDITTNRTLATQVANMVEQTMPAAGPAAESIRQHGGIIVTKSITEAMTLANSAAAEHLVVEDERLAAQVKSAGSVFVGEWSAQVAGDYAIGSNHVLPTAGAARVRGGLSAADFVKQITVQRLSKRGLSAIGASVIALANAEGLTAHAASISTRLARSR